MPASGRTRGLTPTRQRLLLLRAPCAEHDGQDVSRYAQQVVRLALFAEASQGMLKREDINKKGRSPTPYVLLTGRQGGR
jgi:3-deoxy-D-arabino-heptulosonate 7-phosphate (DAHP) synthase